MMQWVRELDLVAKVGVIGLLSIGWIFVIYLALASIAICADAIAGFPRWIVRVENELTAWRARRGHARDAESRGR
jgi:hypothetical protein